MLTVILLAKIHFKHYSYHYFLFFFPLQEVYSILSRISVIHAFDIFSVLEALESVRERMHNQVLVFKTFFCCNADTAERLLPVFACGTLAVYFNGGKHWIELSHKKCEKMTNWPMCYAQLQCYNFVANILGKMETSYILEHAYNNVG